MAESVCDVCKKPNFSASGLMDIEDAIWEQMGIRSGDAISESKLQQRIYLKKLQERLGKPGHQYGSQTYDLLEDANYHTMNNAMLILGYYGDSAKDLYQKTVAKPELNRFALIQKELKKPY